jgi:hypothetical protein
MSGSILRILDGIHAGTDIDLTEQDTWRCGVSEDAHILIADDGSPSSSFTLERQAKGHWRLVADEAALIFAGADTPHAGPVLVKPGTAFAWGQVSFVLLGAAPVAVSPRMSAKAQRHVLWQIDKRRYATSLFKAARRPLQMVGGFAMVSVAAIGVMAKVQPGEVEVERRDPWSSYVSQAFPSVRVLVDPVSGMATYTGYVDSQVELDHLRSVAAAADKGKTIVRVVPMETLAMHADLFLNEFYSSTEVRVEGPGGLAITIPGTAAMKKLASWDFEGMEHRLRSEIPQIQSVRFSVAKHAAPPVAVPWSASGYSVMHTPDEVPVAVDRGGERLFQGAAVKEGALSRVDHCTIELASDGDATLYSFQRGDDCERSARSNDDATD